MGSNASRTVIFNGKQTSIMELYEIYAKGEIIKNTFYSRVTRYPGYSWKEQEVVSMANDINPIKIENNINTSRIKEALNPQKGMVFYNDTTQFFPVPGV